MNFIIAFIIFWFIRQELQLSMETAINAVLLYTVTSMNGIYCQHIFAQCIEKYVIVSPMLVSVGDSRRGFRLACCATTTLLTLCCDSGKSQQNGAAWQQVKANADKKANGVAAFMTREGPKGIRKSSRVCLVRLNGVSKPNPDPTRTSLVYAVVFPFEGFTRRPGSVFLTA